MRQHKYIYTMATYWKKDLCAALGEKRTPAIVTFFKTY